MKLIDPKFEILEQQFPVQKMDMDNYIYRKMLETELYRHIEKCGRTCYKSEDKITEDSAKPFVDRMIASKHYAMLEHGTVYLCSDRGFSTWKHLVERYGENKYSTLTGGFADYDCHVTTNLRVLVENNWLDDLQYLCKPTMFHKKRYTVRFVSDIHFYKDITRHRVMSFAIESTRFCNYLKERFGGSVMFAKPCWLKSEEEEEFKKDCELIEQLYFKWLNKGWSPQEAAYFLCQGVKAEVIMTGFGDDYEHFFDLRALGTTGAPLPTVKELAEPLMEEFINRGYISDIRNENISES